MELYDGLVGKRICSSSLTTQVQSAEPMYKRYCQHAKLIDCVCFFSLLKLIFYSLLNLIFEDRRTSWWWNTLFLLLFKDYYLVTLFVACTVTSDHGINLAQAAARSHVWISDPIATRVCINVSDSSYTEGNADRCLWFRHQCGETVPAPNRRAPTPQPLERTPHYGPGRSGSSLPWEA